MLMKSLLFLFAVSSSVYCDDRLRYVFYFGTVETIQTTTYNVNSLPSLLNHPSFNRNMQTVFFHYSTDQSLSSVQVHDVITSYIFSRDYNLVVIGYENNDVVTTANANALAQGITTSTISFCDAGYSSSLVYFIGFGLGAHIMGRASRQIPGQSAGRHNIPRLTGLDPVSLNIVNGNSIGRISQFDALYVETIHTETALRGDSVNSRGTTWYIVNGATTQPFCNQPLPGARADCSHFFALTAWAESVRSPVRTFPSLSCATWDQFTAGACNANSVAWMGRSTDITVRGSHMLRTNDNPPFSRDVATP